VVGFPEHQSVGKVSGSSSDNDKQKVFVIHFNLAQGVRKVFLNRDMDRGVEGANPFPATPVCLAVWPDFQGNA